MIQHENNYNKDVFLKHLENKKDQIKVIFEVGSRDCLDAIFLNRYFGGVVHTFEPNPSSYVDCLRNLDLYENKERIKINNLAVWNENTKISFYPVINGNHGASSCYKCSQIHPTEKYLQNEIEVETTTLNYYCEINNIKSIDLLVMDAQGAEYNCLLGLGNMLKDVKFIITEAIFKPLYSDMPLNDTVKSFLEMNNFTLIETWNNHPNGDWWGDQLFINNKYV